VIREPGEWTRLHDCWLKRSICALALLAPESAVVRVHGAGALAEHGGAIKSGRKHAAAAARPSR